MDRTTDWRKQHSKGGGDGSQPTSRPKQRQRQNERLMWAEEAVCCVPLCYCYMNELSNKTTTSNKRLDGMINPLAHTFTITTAKRHCSTPAATTNNREKTGHNILLVTDIVYS